MSLSVIIAHYAPKSNCAKYVSLLKKTILSVRNQKVDFEVEIIVCDDGSYWSKDLSDSEDILVLTKEKITQTDLLKNLNIDLYIALPDRDRYRGVRLKNEAIIKARYNKIIVLDDDHPLIRKNSLALFNKYLDKYKYVRGRVIGPKGRPQLYLSKNAQGTTYGLTKEFYYEIGGFGKYLYENGFGEDNDILWRSYYNLTTKYDKKKKYACWAGDIYTKDLATDRWADRSASQIKSGQNSEIINIYQREPSFIKEFISLYNTHPYKNNPSRNKIEWIAIPSAIVLIFELKFLIIYLFKAHQIILSKYRRVKKRGGMKYLVQRLKGDTNEV